MTAIRSLADELREKMRQGTVPEAEEIPAENKKSKTKKGGKAPPAIPEESVEALLLRVSSFELTGNEKLLIRLDNRTVFLLKQLKVTRGIDMNKLIAFSVESFFNSNPELISFIKSSLQIPEL